jgi:hypothetical protein
MAAQSGSARRLAPRCDDAVSRSNSMSFSAASLSSAGNGQASPAACARPFKRATVERARLTTCAMRRSLIP